MQDRRITQKRSAKAIDESRDKSIEETREECREALKKLVNKKNVFFTTRCNKSIELAFLIASIRSKDSNFEFDKLFIQKQGGWITYSNYAKKYKLELMRLDNSNNGQINLDQKISEEISKSNSIIILHSMPGYAYLENMKDLDNKLRALIEKKEKKEIKNLFLINDCSGSIGTSDARIGDIIVCSFGKAKPLSLGVGGFIAGDNFTEKEIEVLKKAENEALAKINFELLNKVIEYLPTKLHTWKLKKQEMENKLLAENFQIINKGQGINILVDIQKSKANEKVDFEKERLIKFCDENKLEYVECPRYIRTMENSISIEIKRLED